jgi:hypothetical protein
LPPGAAKRRHHQAGRIIHMFRHAIMTVKRFNIIPALSILIALWASTAQAVSLSDLEELSVRKVRNNGDYLLEIAWPAALFFGGLAYQSTSVADSGYLGDGYYVSVRLHYLNIIDQRQWIKFLFTYDDDGDIKKIEILGYSDIIAPSFISSSKLINSLF